MVDFSIDDVLRSSDVVGSVTVQVRSPISRSAVGSINRQSSFKSYGIGGHRASCETKKV